MKKTLNFKQYLLLLWLMVATFLTACVEDAPPVDYYYDVPQEQIEVVYEITYEFRKDEYLMEHFEKHGHEFGYTTAEEYLEGANRVIASEDVLHKIEAEDGDDVYYLEATNEFVVVSTDGYIRTYFKPNDGIEYFNRQ